MGYLYELNDREDALRQFMRNEVYLFKRGFIMLISAGRKGKMGCGKSLTAVNIARGLDKHFTMEDVCFTAKDFQARIRAVEQKRHIGRVLVLDEAQTAIPAAEYMSFINKTIFYILSTFRHLRIIVIIVTPSMSWIDKRIRQLIYIWGSTTMEIEDGKRRVYLSVSLLTTDFFGDNIYAERMKFYNTIKHKAVYCKKFFVEPLPKEWVDAYEEKAARLKAQIRVDIERAATEYDDAMLGTGTSAPITIAKELKNDLLVRGEFEKERKVSQITVNMLRENLNREDARYIALLVTRMLGAEPNATRE